MEENKTITFKDAIKMNRHQRRGLASVNKLKNIPSEANYKEAPRKAFKHLLYVPFTGLGLYNGFRGNKWLKKRIQIFKQFVVPSLHAQINQNFIIWISWRPEEKNNHIVKEFYQYLRTEFGS